MLCLNISLEIKRIKCGVNKRKKTTKDNILNVYFLGIINNVSYKLVITKYTVFCILYFTVLYFFMNP